MILDILKNPTKLKWDSPIPIILTVNNVIYDFYKEIFFVQLGGHLHFLVKH